MKLVHLDNFGVLNLNLNTDSLKRIQNVQLQKKIFALLGMGKKYILKFAHHLLSPHQSTKLTIDENNIVVSNYQRIISDKLHIEKECLQFFSKITYQGAVYKRKNYVAIFEADISIFLILDIVLVKKKTFSFLYRN